MAGDYSRQRFDPGLDFSAVLMQQGRVQLDADWNELIDILDRRLRAETTDIIGRCTVPKETPHGFEIGLAGGMLTIGRGRAYVHGLLAENHGKPPAENHGKPPLDFDAVLAEVRGTAPWTYAEQPYFPNATVVEPLPRGGPHLVYLDVWQREVTYLERPELVEKAVGVDTTTRIETVWQVRVLPNVGAGVNCATHEDQIPGWLDRIRPSAGRLSTAAVGVAATTDPCVIPPSGGYRGLENHLYRLEIHDGGPPGTATFKWSRDNATVATSVSAILPLDTLTVAQTGRDPILRFATGDWVEITDDWHELAQKPGTIRQVKDVNDALQTITLTRPLPAGEYPTDAQGKTDLQRHIRIRRWDQKGQVRDTAGSLIVDLDTPNSAGVIPVPTPGTLLVLEAGVQITFGLESAGGRFRVGDYWTSAARTADASVEQLQNAPPRGIHHHYCRLALVTFPDAVTDCRTLWPPEFGAAGCECSVCVTPESHNNGNGTLTVQRAIDQVKATGGTVCLGPGIYSLGETPISINGAQSVRVRGHGWRTILLHPGPGPAVIVENSLGVTLEEMTLLTAAGVNDLVAAVALRNTAGLTIQRCFLLRLGAGERGERGGPAIGLGGVLIGTTIRENMVFAPIGVGLGVMPATETVAVAPQLAPLLTALLLVENNALFCSRRGISLDGLSLHALETRLAGNFLNDCPQGGIVALGWVASGSSLNVHGNELHATGPGIVVGTAGASVGSNEISPLQAGRDAAGILLMTGLDRGGIDHCQVLGNRITGVAGDGVSIQTALRSAMIKNNIIDGVGGGGIVMSENSRADTVCIENNQVLNIAPQVTDTQRAVVGIRVVQAQRAEVASNSLVRIGGAAVRAPIRAGIQVISSVAARIVNNDVTDVGPAEFVQAAAGIEYLGTFDHLEVLNNSVRRTPPTRPAPGKWFAVHIRAPQPKSPIVSGTFLIAAAARGIFTFAGNWLALLPRGREGVGLNGNWLDAYGDAPAVFVQIGGTFAFNNNQCLLLALQRQPVADVQAGTLIASGNHLQGFMEIDALVAAVTDKRRFTVLGNIATGPIKVNGHPLPDPWQKLNVIAP